MLVKFNSRLYRYLRSHEHQLVFGSINSILGALVLSNIQSSERASSKQPFCQFSTYVQHVSVVLTDHWSTILETQVRNPAGVVTHSCDQMQARETLEVNSAVQTLH